MGKSRAGRTEMSVSIGCCLKYPSSESSMLSTPCRCRCVLASLACSTFSGTFWPSGRPPSSLEGGSWTFFPLNSGRPARRSVGLAGMWCTCGTCSLSSMSSSRMSDRRLRGRRKRRTKKVKGRRSVERRSRRGRRGARRRRAIVAGEPWRALCRRCPTVARRERIDRIGSESEGAMGASRRRSREDETRTNG